MTNWISCWTIVVVVVAAAAVVVVAAAADGSFGNGKTAA